MSSSTTKGQEREKSLDPENYLTDAYFSLEQLWSLTEQVHHLHFLRPTSLLEIGPGNGFVCDFLKKTGMKIKTTDINPQLSPDILCPVQELHEHVSPNDFDWISCCEVLEHLPFDSFEEIISQFSKLSSNLFLTLPCSGRIIGFGGIWMKSWGRRWCSKWRHFPAARYPLPSMHFWEVGWERQHRTSALVHILEKYYNTLETRPFHLNPYHRMFVCKGSKFLKPKEGS